MKYFLFFLGFLWLAPLLAQQSISIDSITTYAGRYYYTQPDSAQYFLHKGIKLAEAQNDPYKKGIFLNKLITQKTRIRDYDSARYYYRISKAFLENNKLTPLIPDVHSEIAESYYYMEKMDSALYHFKKADFLYEQMGDSIGVLISKNNIANVYQIQGNYKDAIVNMLEAAKNVDTTQYLYIKVELYQNISQLYQQVHEDKKSLEFAQKSLQLALQNPNYPQDMVSAYALLADRAIASNQFQKAEQYIQEAKKTIATRNLESVNYKILSSEASLLVAKEKYQEAIPFIERALEAGENQNLNDFEVFSLKKDLALCLVQLDRWDEAKSLLGQLLESAQEDGRLEDMSSLYALLSEAHKKAGNPTLALANFKKHIQYKDSVLGLQKQEIINDAMVRYETVIKEKELLETRATLAEKELEVERKNLFIYGSLGLALVLALLGYLFYNQQRLKNRQFKKEAELKTALAKIETQNRLQEQRLRISRDLHDNIGAQLTFVTSSVDNLAYKLGDDDGEVAQKLTEISNFTTHTIYELRDTIWAMNKEHITVEDLQGRVSNFIEKAGVASGEVTFEFKVSSNISQELLLPSIQGMNVYRMIQEAVNNALKYAQASHISVTLDQKGGAYYLSIEDNGKGFDPNTVVMGNGLNNIKKRARDLGGEATITSEVGKGTTVAVVFPAA